MGLKISMLPLLLSLSLSLILPPLLTTSFTVPLLLSLPLSPLFSLSTSFTHPLFSLSLTLSLPPSLSHPPPLSLISSRFRVEYKPFNLGYLQHLINTGRVDPSQPIDMCTLNRVNTLGRIEHGIKLLADVRINK